MVYRIYVEKKEGLRHEADSLYKELHSLIGIKALTGLRLLNRYDAEDLPAEDFLRARGTVFSEPQTDLTYDSLPKTGEDVRVLAVEYLPGQFDQRADSAAQCIQLLTQGSRPLVRSAKIYLLYGALSEEDLKEIRKYVINPVEAREASLELPETLKTQYEIPETVPVLSGFTALSGEALASVVSEYGLAMDADDVRFCRDYFLGEKRDPTLTELRVIDTYWSDHCRHTTFLTTVDKVRFDDPKLEAAYARYLAVREKLGRTKPVNLMDVGTIAAKYLKAEGLLDKLDESEEINACTVKITVTMDGKEEPWLLLFKNETHNHPTEIEPFGGAATCIGGAIRDPLSGRSYVYGAMRLTGAADPTVPVSETIPGKLPQRKIVQTAAAGYSSYGNQIGLATGIVDELYHPGYAAKHLELGAVIAAAPQENVRRETPLPGDVVILLGGRTGRDGIGGATGSSKAHTTQSVETCGAEVQKGNAPEERKLQRIFRNAEACRMIKRCNDFGAGGVSVAVGELADGLLIDLNKVPRKYEGLDGTELAISESQERMAVVVEEKDAARFAALAEEENLEATVIARVTEEKRMRMVWNGVTIVDLSREFLNSNGAEKHTEIVCPLPASYEKQGSGAFREDYLSVLSDLNVCSKRGLSERFDSTIGAGSVLMPFGGKYQRTPVQAMVQKISSEEKHTDDCSFMSFGANPVIAEKDPYAGAYLAVTESLAKLVASGADFSDVYLSFQEFFKKPGRVPERWGEPFAALLGALSAQLDYGVAAIGGKDSMSGSFENIDVPPTFVSFAVTNGKTADVVTNELKKAGNELFLFRPLNKDGLPDAAAEKALFGRVTALMRAGKILSCYTPGFGGIAEAAYKMAAGSGFGLSFSLNFPEEALFSYAYGAFLAEAKPEDADTFLEAGAVRIAKVTEDAAFVRGEERIPSAALNAAYEDRLEGVYPTLETKEASQIEAFSFPAAEKQHAPVLLNTAPKVLIPVFPGTNCEIDSARAFRDAGADPEIFVINNLTQEGIKNSVTRFASLLRESQMLFLPGGFSGGDEPDGSGKFICAFLRNAEIGEEVRSLLDVRGGLIAGICNGFQALVKLGLVPYGRIVDADRNAPTLTFNTIGRHQSKLVRTRIASNRSPWLSETTVGDIYTVPISHGEGRFLATEEMVRTLALNGQIATQYVDENGMPTDDIRYNPNGSVYAIEGITSPDGRVLGKMGHSERIGDGLYKNVPGTFEMGMFRSAVRFFKEN